MPDWVWIPIVVVGSTGAIAFIAAMVAKGGTFSVGKNTFVLHGDEKEPANPLARALKNVPDNIGLVTSLVFAHYLKIVKGKGVDPAVMTDIEDVRFARSLIRNATSMGNGSNSVQKIIESTIANRDWDGEDIEAYIRRSVIPRIIDTIKNTINSEYDSVAHYAEYSTRQRIVTQAEFIDMLVGREFKEELVHILIPFYEFAKRCLNNGCKD